MYVAIYATEVNIKYLYHYVEMYKLDWTTRMMDYWNGGPIRPMMVPALEAMMPVTGRMFYCYYSHSPQFGDAVAAIPHRLAIQ